MSISSVIEYVLVMAIWTPQSYNYCQVSALFLVRNSSHLLNQHSIISPYDTSLSYILVITLRYGDSYTFTTI